MPQESAIFTYSKSWLRGLMKELIIADRFLFDLLNTVQKYPLVLSADDINSFSEDIRIFREQLPNFEKLNELNTKFQNFLDRICCESENRDALYQEIVSLWGEICTAEFRFSQRERSNAFRKMPKFGPMP